MRYSMLFVVAVACLPPTAPRALAIDRKDPKVRASARRGLDYLARVQQPRLGYWEANNEQYKVAMTALAGMAMLCEGSTPTQGRYAKNIRLAVDFLLEMGQPTGLIGYPETITTRMATAFRCCSCRRFLAKRKTSRDGRRYNVCSPAPLPFA